jgi:hypothetical protein
MFSKTKKIINGAKSLILIRQRNRACDERMGYRERREPLLPLVPASYGTTAENTIHSLIG